MVKSHGGLTIRCVCHFRHARTLPGHVGLCFAGGADVPGFFSLFVTLRVRNDCPLGSWPFAAVDRKRLARIRYIAAGPYQVAASVFLWLREFTGAQERHRFPVRDAEKFCYLPRFKVHGWPLVVPCQWPKKKPARSHWPKAMVLPLVFVVSRRQRLSQRETRAMGSVALLSRHFVTLRIIAGVVQDRQQRPLPSEFRAVASQILCVQILSNGRRYRTGDSRSRQILSTTVVN